MKILVLNSGSSSIKYQFIEMDNECLLASGLIEKIGFDESFVTFKSFEGKKIKRSIKITNHLIGIKTMISDLTNSEYGVIKSTSEISAIGHRITQSGNIKESVIVTEPVKDLIRDAFKLAPLHNPPQLNGLEAIEDVIPGVPNIATFDTVFHVNIPSYASTYAIPKKLSAKHRIKKYGYHGMSHEFVSKRAAEILGKDYGDFKCITCHLGNGASITAVKNGISIDTSMGFTPLQGLIMGTRCGDIDPSIVTFLIKEEGIDADEVDRIMNRESGVKGISGISSDFRDLEEAWFKEGKKDAKLALDAYYYKVKTYIGSYIATLNGTDAIVFTGGIGENSIYSRSEILSDLDNLGIKVDNKANDIRGIEQIISSIDSKIKILVIPTNEELVIARDVKSLLSK